MTQANEPAFPVATNLIVHQEGLTKREILAGMAMSSMAVTWYPEDEADLSLHPDQVARVAVKYADALLAELAKPEVTNDK